jgi:predicted nucleic acid-binding protein
MAQSATGINQIGRGPASDCAMFAKLPFGVEKSARRKANRARLQAFAAGVRVLPFDLALATRYATVRAALERKGRPKTDFDLVITSTAMEHGAIDHSEGMRLLSLEGGSGN